MKSLHLIAFCFQCITVYSCLHYSNEDYCCQLKKLNDYVDRLEKLDDYQKSNPIREKLMSLCDQFENELHNYKEVPQEKIEETRERIYAIYQAHEWYKDFHGKEMHLEPFELELLNNNSAD